ncbi:hypothetical protein XENORESO_017792 [Xenotaenia resolanae]|uniref:Uncharacterized protein n=1 Tax=Xenotaenia resolanae TaxID=208358 RepID=A0ABV0VQ02_9TELE
MVFRRIYGLRMTTSGHAPYEMTDGVLGYLLPDPDQSITDLLDSLRCDLAVLEGPKHDVPEMFYWTYVRAAWRPINGINSFILQESWVQVSAHATSSDTDLGLIQNY